MLFPNPTASSITNILHQCSPIFVIGELILTYYYYCSLQSKLKFTACVLHFMGFDKSNSMDSPFKCHSKQLHCPQIPVFHRFIPFSFPLEPWATTDLFTVSVFSFSRMLTRWSHACSLFRLAYLKQQYTFKLLPCLSWLNSTVHH